MSNIFLAAALASTAQPGLEEVANQKPVGVDAIHTNQDLQPKPHVGKGEAYTGEFPVKAEVGEDHPFGDHDEIDTVAASQEDTLALEALAISASQLIRYGSALEEIAQTVEGNLEAGVPLDPVAASMVTTALDASSVGEPVADSVALEAFDFSLTAATESFVDTIKERAAKVADAIGEFAKKTMEVARRKVKRFVDYLRSLPKIVEALQKEIGVTEGLVGKNFEDEKLEKKVQKAFYAPTSARSPIDICRGAMAEYDASSKALDSQFHSEVAAMNRAVGDSTAEQAVTAMNKAMNFTRGYLKKHCVEAQYSTFDVQLNFPEKLTIGTTSGMLTNPISWEMRKGRYDNALKIAGPQDLAALKELAMKAERLLASTTDAAQFGGFALTTRRRSNEKELGFWDNAKLVATYRSLVFLMVHAWAWGEQATAQGVYYNFFAATGWVRASIAEARAQKRAASKAAA